MWDVGGLLGVGGGGGGGQRVCWPLSKIIGGGGRLGLAGLPLFLCLWPGLLSGANIKEILAVIGTGRWLLLRDVRLWRFHVPVPTITNISHRLFVLEQKCR